MGFAQGEEKMANKPKGTTGSKTVKYQIEATIEKFSRDGVRLKGTGKYLFEKSSKKENEENKEYWNILEGENFRKLEFMDSAKDYQIDIPKNESGIQHLLGYAFAEKKKLKFILDDKFTIIEVSNVST